jgi:hypothetical protein
MKTGNDEPTGKAKERTPLEKTAPTTGGPTTDSEDTGNHGAAAKEPTNHQQKLVHREPRRPALALMIGDTEVVLPDEVDSGKPNAEPLTAQELIDLRRYEIEIEENKVAFLTMAADLFEIWSRRLYRENYRSFKQYCRERWDFSRAYGYQLINAHKTIAKMSTIVDTPIPITSGTQALVLAKVPEDQQAEVVKNAMQKAANGKLTSRHIKEAAQELEGRITTQDATSATPTEGTPKSNTASIATPAQVYSDTQILPLGELSKMTNTLHDIFLNPSRHAEAQGLLLKLKEQLRLHAEREAQHLGAVQLKHAA